MSTILFSALSEARACLDEERKRTISLLIHEGGSQLIRPNSDPYFPDYNSDKKYLRYTPLHLACEWNFQKQALQLIAKIKEEGLSLDARSLKKERQSGQDRFTKYHYTCLHLAIAKGQQELAIKMIEAGASIEIKAVIQRPTTYFLGFFSEVEHIEKTPLEMAIELNQTEVIHKIQLIMLDDYIAKREKEEEYLSHVTVFGYTLFRFGCYSKTKKLEEALAFKKILLRGQLNDEDLEKINQGPLSQGRLGQIAKLSHYRKNSFEIPDLKGFKI